MVNHINHFNVIFLQLNSIGIFFDDKMKTLILVPSLPESSNGTITIVSSSSRGNKLLFNNV